MNPPRPRLSYYVAASLDGFIARADGALDWLHPFENHQEDYGYQSLLDQVDGLIMGRRTYEQCLALSPGQWLYGDRICRVLTSWLPATAQELPGGVAFTDQSPRGLLADLSAQGHRHCWLVGGGETAGHFLREDLIDEIILTLVPTPLGQGIPLFGHGGPTMDRKFSLVAAHPYATGLVQMRYKRADQE